MTPDLLGKMLALSNAAAWAVALIFFKQSGSRVPPLALNLFKNVIGILGIVLTLLAIAAIYPDERSAWPTTLFDMSGRNFWLLIISGVIGIAIADSIFFYGLNLAGVGLTAIVDCLYTPFMMLFAYFMLGEHIGPIHLLGAALILSAVFLASGHKPPIDRTRGQILLGMGLAATAVGLMAFGIILAKPALTDQPVLWTTMIRLVAGTIALLMLAPAVPGLAAVVNAFRPSRDWRVTVPGSFFGAYLAMITWIGGIKYTDASIAAMLNQTSTIFALILAAIILREPLRPARMAAVLLAFTGVGVVTFHQQLSAWLAEWAGAVAGN